MREALFILIVVLILFALTAIRYRKQIASILGVAKMLNDAKNAAKQGNQANKVSGGEKSVQLVNCAKCGVWVPQNKAIKRGEDFFYCSNECSIAKARA